MKLHDENSNQKKDGNAIEYKTKQCLKQAKLPGIRREIIMIKGSIYEKAKQA